jgi:ankyrin repeat protein
MNQPVELKSHEPLKWSPGTGVDVWEMFCACVAGDLGVVQRLAAKDAALVRSQHVYRTPIYFAVRENRLDVARFLLEHGADPLSLAVGDSLLEICRDRGYAEMEALVAAHLANVLGASPRGEAAAAAIRAHDMDEMRRLLDAEPELLHAGDIRSNQPIHWATMTRQLDFVDELLARGADVNARRYDGARPIHLNNGDYYFRGWRDVPADWPTRPREVIEHLRARGAYCDVCMACHIGDEERVRELLAEDPSLANRIGECLTYYQGSGAPLKNAAASGHMAIVELLLAHGANPNLREEGIAPNGHALYAAVANKHFEIAKLLLEHGAHPNQEVESSADAFSRAVMNGDQPMIDLLASYGAARNVDIMAYYNDVATAAAVFAANPAKADDPVALAGAASEGNELFLRLMLRYQPDLPRRISFPAWAVGAKSRELNELLFEHGMDASQRDWLMITPLHQLARKGDVEQARQFIEHGAELEARDEDLCSTPLGWAAKFGQKEMVEFLLSRGARTNLDDDPPWATPLAWTTRRGHAEVADVLKGHGAR